MRKVADASLTAGKLSHLPAQHSRRRVCCAQKAANTRAKKSTNPIQPLNRQRATTYSIFMTFPRLSPTETGSLSIAPAVDFPACDRDRYPSAGPLATQRSLLTRSCQRRLPRPSTPPFCKRCKHLCTQQCSKHSSQAWRLGQRTIVQCARGSSLRRSICTLRERARSSYCQKATTAGTRLTRA